MQGGTLRGKKRKKGEKIKKLKNNHMVMVIDDALINV